MRRLNLEHTPHPNLYFFVFILSGMVGPGVGRKRHSDFSVACSDLSGSDWVALSDIQLTNCGDRVKGALQCVKGALQSAGVHQARWRSPERLRGA